MKRGLALAALVAALLLPGRASASYAFGDTNVRAPRLAVNGAGIALVTYVTATGTTRHVLAWGAVGGVAHPTSPPVAQQRFHLDYSGGWASRHDGSYWRTFRDACRPYGGPPLPFFVAGCTAPDGSEWALQRWQRNLPMRGYAPWTPAQSAVELHLSHWSGSLPVLDVTVAWTYGGVHQGIFGRFVYQGLPVYGAHTASSRSDDAFARNVSIDTYDSSYGAGWRHVTAVATDAGDGGFCYSFVPQPPPAGYPSNDTHGDGLGTRLRVVAMGPGVTPIVEWTGSRLPGSFDPGANAAARSRFDTELGADRHCASERPS